MNTVYNIKLRCQYLPDRQKRFGNPKGKNDWKIDFHFSEEVKRLIKILKRIKCLKNFH
jgi:hypothetical protein